MRNLSAAIELFLSVPAYSGTTVANFRKCSFDQSGRLFFDKSREPLHRDQKFWCNEDFGYVANYSACLAREVRGDFAVIMQGRVPRLYSYKREWPHRHIVIKSGFKFPIDRIWISETYIDNNNYTDYFDKKDCFVEKDPRELIRI